jgi:hypothetical protein
MVIWLILFFLEAALPIARGRILLSVGPFEA